MSSVAAPYGATTAMADLDAITDEERLRIMWQQAEDFGERRRIRARMYKLREQRLREMMQNDEESLGTLNVTDDGGVTECSETTITVEGGSDSTRRSSNIQVTMHVDGDSAVTESISTQNVRLGGLTMRGVDTVSLEGLQPDDIIEERIRKASEDRATRFQRIMGELSDSEANSEGEAVVSITKNTYSIQSNALAGGGYLSMKNKEVRDSVSPTRIMRERRSSAEDETSANEGRLISDDEVALKADSENVLQAMQTSTSKTSSSRKTSKEEKTSTRTTRSRQSEIPVRKESSSRRVSERKTSKELDLSSVKRTGGEKTSPTSPTKHTPGESSSRSQMPRRTGAQKEAPTSPAKSPTRTSNKGVPSKKSKLAEIESKMETSIMSELDKLDSYLKASVSDDDDEIIMEEEEDCVDDSGNIVKMLVQTRRKKDGTECTARRVARSTKVVNTESEIDEILIGNPDHEVLERDVAEEEDKEGNKIKIITETRRRPDGITYTTKNILKTSKIFDYDHPEDVAYNEEDELISTDETEETDENGITIQTITETRRKPNGMEYTTKKVYKTSKVKSTQITPSDDDEVIDTKETEEKKDDGSIIRTVIETRRTKTGEEYTHRQVFRSRRMTLSGVDLQKGLPIMQNDDEVINKKEKEETDDNGVTVKVVTETRRRKDGSTYSFEYVLRTFHGTEDDVKKIPVGGPGSSNIAVSADDELINEDVKEDVKEDGSTVKTIIERRRAKDGTEYLRHRIMRIPKMPEPVLQVASLDDEVLQEEVKEKTLNDGTHYKAVTERRRSSVSGLQYTLRRMSKTYQQPTHHPRSSEDEILDENVTEEETDDGTVVKTVIQRYQRPDGSVYTTHNIHRTFSSPAPVTFVGTEDDELVDQSVDEKETEDGYIIKTVIERRRRSDGVQYTVERTEKTSKFGPQVHIKYRSNESPRKPEEFVQLGSPDDMVVSCEENEYEEEDGTIVKSVVEIRRRVDGTEYTTKTVIRSTPVLVPERETSYVVIKHEGGNDDEEVGFFPSLDDEVVYTRRKEEIGDDGEPISVIIETRQSKTSGEKYNITKRVHTKDVVLTEEGEKEIPKTIMKSTLVANIAPSKTTKRENKKPSTTEEPEDDQDDVPYGSVSALKNRFVPTSSKKTESADKPSKPDRLNTLNKKKFFEDAAKSAGGSSPIPKSTPRKLEPKDRPREPDKDAAKRDLLPAFSDDKASIEVKLRIEKDQATVEDVETHKLTYQTKKDLQEKPDISVETKDVDIKDLDTEIAKLEEEEKWRYKQDQLEPEDIEEPEEEMSPDEVEPDEEVYSPSEEEPAEPLQKPAPSKKSPTASRKTIEKPRKIEEPRKKRETSPRKKPEADESTRRVPATSRKVPSKEDSPTRRVPAPREPITPKESTKRVPKSTTSPQRVPSSPHRGRSPNRSGVSTPRDVTPTGRNFCKTHREANEKEPVSPTRTQKKPRSTVPTVKKTTSPEGKPRMNGDVRRVPTEPRMNGDINKRPEDRTPRTRRPIEKSSEPEKSGVRPTKLSQTPKKSPTARSPDKREPTKSLPSRTPDRKSPTKSSERAPKGRSPDSEQREKPKSTLSVPESRDPVVTLPETPMREDMKRLPVDDELGPEIEDVSCEPDLPYHTIHRPSIVREPSEHPAIDSQEEASDSAPEEQPEYYEEPSDTELEDKKTVKSSRKPQQEPSPTREDVSKPRKTKPLESRPSDKSLPLKDSEVPRKKQPETRKPRDRPWLIEKRSSFEKKPSETKPSTVKPDDDKKVERRKPFEQKPSEEIVKKPKGGKPLEKLPDEEIYSSSDSEGKENGITEEITKEVILPTQEAPEDDKQPPRKTEEIFKKRTDFEKPVISQIITEKNEKNITTSDVAARRSVFNVKISQPDAKKDIKPTRKPSYEIKESVFSKRSLFEQPKQEHIPSPIRKPLLKSSVKKDDKPQQPEERKPAKEPVIVPKYFHPLGESDGDEPVEKAIPEPVEEEVRMTSSKLVMNAMATTSQTNTTEVRRESTKQEPLKKERSPSPYSKERSSLPHSKEGTPVPRSKESSPAPFAKEGSPTRFITGKPIDSGINTNKIRRIERTGSNKKLLEDLEVSRDSLPQYLSSIETIFDVTILENMLEKAETYEERRIIRGQLRIAKRPGSRTTTPSNTVPSKKFTPVSSQPRRPDDQRATKPEDSEEPNLCDTTRKPLSKLEEPDTLPVSQQPEEDQPAYTTSPATSPSSIRRPRKTSRDSFEPAEEPTLEPAEAEEPRSPRKYIEDEPEKYEPDEPKKPERQIKPDEPRRFGRNIQPEEPRRFGQNVQPEEPRKFGRSVQPEEPRKFGRNAQPEEPRRFGQSVQPEEPRKFGRSVQPEEPRKAEPLPKVPEPSKPGKTQTQPTKTAPSDEPYSEPLRYQKGQSRTPSKPTTEQSDVDKIVSAYGVGPTDENGLPLFGLRALKRRSPPTTCVSTPRDEQTEPTSQEPRPQEEPQPHSEPEEEEPKTEEYEPKDSSGRPLFGLRALRKPQPITSTSTTESERTTTVTERRETASSVMESSRLVSSVVSQRPAHTTEVDSTESPRDSASPEPEDLDSESEDETESIERYSDEEETSPGLVRNLRDSLRKKDPRKEPRSTRPAPHKDTPSGQSPDTLSRSPEDEVITRRSQPLKEILKLHESKDKTKEMTIKDQLNSTDDILDTLTEDQITRLSEEFDLRAQDDGVIKTEESVEELSGGYRVTSRTEAEHPDGSKFVRKTSYTEIKLQQPSKEDGSRVVSSSSSATVEQSSGATFHVSRGTNESGDDTMREGRSFLDDRSKVTGITDVLSRMGATEAVDHEGKVTSDDQARSLLNRFLGAQVLMSGVESMMASSSLSDSSRVVTEGESRSGVTQEASSDATVTHLDASYSTAPVTTTTTSSTSTSKGQAEHVVVRGVNISEVTDDHRLNQLLDSCDEYEDRRRIRMRLKTLMAEKKALREELSGHDLGQGLRTQANSAHSKFEAVSKSTTSSSKESNLRSSEGENKASTVSPFGVSRTSATETRDSSQAVQKSSYSSSFSTSSTSNSSSFITKTDSKKVVSPFDKFKQLDAQTSPRPASSKSKSAGGGPLFQLSSQLSRSASGVKDMLLTWCQCRTRDYKGVKIENFSTSWNDGMAFCALIHHYYPDAFDFDKLEPKNRRYNFELAFRVADEKAGIMPLLDVDDMVMMKKPDWKCVFTYVQSLYKRLKDE